MQRLLTDTTALPCLLFAMVFDAAGRGRLLEPGAGTPPPPPKPPATRCWPGAG